MRFLVALPKPIPPCDLLHTCRTFCAFLDLFSCMLLYAAICCNVFPHTQRLIQTTTGKTSRLPTLHHPPSGQRRACQAAAQHRRHPGHLLRRAAGGSPRCRPRMGPLPRGAPWRSWQRWQWRLQLQRHRQRAGAGVAREGLCSGFCADRHRRVPRGKTQKPRKLKP